MKRSGDLVIARDLTPPSKNRTWRGPRDRVIGIMQTITAALREIFDESAYDRFLLRTHAARSVASYRAFTSERDAAMVKKPRCC